MFLLDTNVIAELRKTSTGKANPRVVAWSNGISRHDAFVSAITTLGAGEGHLAGRAS
jgi:toxin FitB